MLPSICGVALKYGHFGFTFPVHVASRSCNTTQSSLSLLVSYTMAWQAWNLRPVKTLTSPVCLPTRSFHTTQRSLFPFTFHTSSYFRFTHRSTIQTIGGKSSRLNGTCKLSHSYCEIVQVGTSSMLCTMKYFSALIESFTAIQLHLT